MSGPYNEEKKEYMKKYYQRNREKILAFRKAEDVEHRRQVRREHYYKNRESILSKMRVYQESNKVKSIAWHRKGNKDYTIRLRNELLEAYGNKCECCGETEREFLTLDHVGGGGNNHRRGDGWKARGKALYLRLKRQGFPKYKWRLLCMNCNFAIRLGATCPHQQVDTQRILSGIAC